MKRLSRIFSLTIAGLCLMSSVAAPAKPSATTGPGTGCTLGAPGGTPADGYMAFFDPYEYAWRLFLALNAQASTTSPGSADNSKHGITQYDPDKAVVWETLALASGGRSGPFRRTIPNRSEVYLDKGSKPLPWGTWVRSSPAEKHLEPFQAEVPDSFGATAARAQIAPSLPASAQESASFSVFFSDSSVIDLEQIGEEVRTNKCAYEFIVANDLYNVEGLEAKAREGLNPRKPTNPDLISFPKGAQEVKAKWVEIASSDKPRYHWRTIKDSGGKVRLYGLVGLHITSRDLPNWFWTSFEHVDTEQHAEYPSVDPTTRGEAATKRAGAEEGVRIETKGSKWEYYRLRGVQIDFSTSTRPVILANSQIEHGFQQTSSCMTCHSRAVVGLRTARPDLNPCQPNSLPVFLISTEEPGLENERAIRYGPVGSPDPSWFRADGARPRYIQTDFLWSIPFRALSIYETVPQSPEDRPQCMPPKPSEK